METTSSRMNIWEMLLFWKCNCY